MLNPSAIARPTGCGAANPFHPAYRPDGTTRSHAMSRLGLFQPPAPGIEPNVVIDAFANPKLDVEWVIWPAACHVLPDVSSAFSSNTVSAPHPS
jgi:hypothetical protein